MHLPTEFPSGGNAFAEVQVDILGEGIAIDGVGYASAELALELRAAGGDRTVCAAVDPADPNFAFVVVPGTCRLLRLTKVVDDADVAERVRWFTRSTNMAERHYGRMRACLR